MTMDVTAALERLVAGEDLLETEVERLFTAIMQGELAPEQTAGILVALRAKGETIAEVTGAVRAMRAAATPVQAPPGSIDMCGTGGDGSNTVNVSTAAAFVLAAGGVPVAKHGNRSISSKSGSADLLESLNIPIDLMADAAATALREHYFAFLFAPNYHPAMKHAIGPRRALKIRTIFNLLGPMTNPAGVKRQVIGVYVLHWVEPVARVLQQLGAEHVMVVHSDDGMDEISLCSTTQVAELCDGQIDMIRFDPTDYGFRLTTKEQLAGGDAAHNARAIIEAFTQKSGPLADWIALNAASGFRVALDIAWPEAVARAWEVIREDRVLPLIQQLAR